MKTRPVVHTAHFLTGYGHIFPITATGKLVCIVYSFVGIPLLLIFMTDVSEMMAEHVTYIYRCVRVRMRCTVMRNYIVNRDSIN